MTVADHGPVLAHLVGKPKQERPPMSNALTRRAFTAASAAALASVGFGGRARAADSKTLRFIVRTDLRVLDPIWTTAYVSRNHGYMIFDTLFALDSKFKPQPQMVGDYTISPDKLVYRFTLRPGLKFHDGQPVRGADCTASLRRWMARDSLGQALLAATDEMTGGDDPAFTIKLKQPFPLLLDGLAKVSSLVPFIMPERTAKTDPFQQITDTIGSGPFKFMRDEFEPGHKAVYVKNPDYVPRSEPPDWASGGKVVKLDRVEWLVVAEPSTAAAALGGGEVDWWENPSPDLARVLAANPDITVEDTDPLGSMGLLRFNQLLPPFDNVKMRQAVLSVFDQGEFLTALAGDPKDWKRCASFFTCGTPMASDAGTAVLTGKRDFDKAKQLIAEAGYKGEKIIVLDAVDLLTNHIHGLITAELFKKLGLNVELATSDWGTVVTRRASKKPIAEGGWNVFGTDFTGAEMLNPWLNPPLPANGDKAWFGWPKDDKIEALRGEWLQASDSEARQEIAAKIQERAFETVPYVPTGQYFPKTAYRKNVKGVINGPALFQWNVEKA
jgi:peptide/nickel transport system substrate-binding protein